MAPQARDECRFIGHVTTTKYCSPSPACFGFLVLAVFKLLYLLLG